MSKQNQQLINDIIEAVQQGIVASKQSDSNFWGKQMETNARIEKKLDDHLEEHKKQQTDYNEFYRRVEPILKQHEDLQATKRTLLPAGKGIGRGVVFIGSILGAFEIIKIWFKKYF